MKHLLLFLVLALGITGCGKLSEGVVRDIAFPEHDPQIAVTFMARPVADTLVARAHSSAGILDSIGSKRIKEAVFTLEDGSGTSITWGGEADWVQGLGHVLTDVELADGNWTLTVEAPEFETVTAEQVMPPRIDSTGNYAYAYTATVEDEFVDEDEFGYTYLTRTVDLSLTLPDRADAADYFLVRAQKTFNWEDFEEEPEAEFGGYVVLNPSVEDDPRIVWNQLCGGYLIQDIEAVEALNGLPFQLFQEAWGPEFVAVSAEPVVLEVCAISEEMAQYYERLDLIDNPSGGPLFTEPVLAYSNVSSGYGCFGLYTSSTLPLTFE
jgi:hypothetical protein